MPFKKNAYKEIGYMASILGSTAITILSMFPNDRLLYTKYCTIIMACKSLIFVDMKISDTIHHITSLALCLLYLYYYSIDAMALGAYVEEFYILMNVNVSSIFLGLRRYNKSKIIDLSFLLTFIYHRSVFIYNYLFVGLKNVEYVCGNRQTCKFVMDKMYLTLTLLNIYWFCLILRKAKRKMIKQD